MKVFRIEFAFDDESGKYLCYADCMKDAIDDFELMVEEMGVDIDLLRIYEVKHGLETDKPAGAVTH